MTNNSAPFADLSPELILDALDSIGVHSDGRLLALNSCENRVYQVGMEEGAPLVAKFYRPARWSDEAILEEHAFMQSLAAAEIPVVPALVLENHQTLHDFNGYRFAIFVNRRASTGLDSAGFWNGWGALSDVFTRLEL